HIQKTSSTLCSSCTASVQKGPGAHESLHIAPAHLGKASLKRLAEAAQPIFQIIHVLLAAFGLPTAADKLLDQFLDRLARHFGRVSVNVIARRLQQRGSS